MNFDIMIGKRRITGELTENVTLHHGVRHQLGCTWCKNYTKKIDSAVCTKCCEKYTSGYMAVVNPDSRGDMPDYVLEMYKEKYGK